jgi:hypothetical protein
VDHRHPHPVERQLEPVGQASDQVTVVVAQHGMDRCEGAQGVEQVLRDDVPGVEDHVGRLGLGPHLGRQLGQVGPEVRVGQDERSHRQSPSDRPMISFMISVVPP